VKRLGRRTEMKWILAAFFSFMLMFSGRAEAGPVYAFEEICYLSCEEAWEKAEQSVDNATEMIKVLGEFSLGKRGLTFPEDEALGRQLGELIKASCTDEPEDLLFNAVDKSLRRILVESKE
jgi:hypothetical protein